MSLPVIVDIAIGLVFIYLLLSLLASEIQELIATILQWRAKHLKDSITNLFASDVHSNHSVEKAHKLAKQVYQRPLIRGINQESKGFLPNLFRGITWLISRLYQWIAGKSEGEFGDRRTAPSYIPREAFATALLEQLGTKYFVERLVEAKFSEFVAWILEKVGAGEETQTQADCKKFRSDLLRIEEDFIEDRINLESAVNSIKDKLDNFLSDVEDKINANNLEALKGWQEGEDKDKANELEELQDWKSRFFLEKLDHVNNKIDQVIVNAGLKPTLQEIVDSIDKDSKTYRTYKERFYRYEQERFKEVHEELKYFKEFLLGFLESLLNKESSKILFFLESTFQDKPNITVLENLVFKYDLPGSSEANQQDKIRQTRTPIAEIEQVIVDNLKQLEIDKATTKKHHIIRAFREGFEGKNSIPNWRDFGLFRESIFSKIIPFSLLFLIGFFLAVVLSDMSLKYLSDTGWLEQRVVLFRNLLIGPQGGWVVTGCLVGVPFLWFTLSRAFFEQCRRRKKLAPSSNESDGPQAERSGKTLAEIFDNYSVDEISREEKASTSTSSDNPKTASNSAEEQSPKRFVKDIAARIQELRDESDAVFYNEVKDLGRSFRRYYLRLVLENADIDLPFIPSSIKQSLAVLIRRSKISARQAEDQVLHLKAEVEDWYDRSMERASGVYRRNAKGISILIGISLAIAVNANSLHILDQLAFDDELRQTIVESAQQSLENADTSAREEVLAELEQSLDDINLPIGWDPYLINEEFNCNLSKPSSALSTPDQPPALWHTLIQSCIYGQDNTDTDTTKETETETETDSTDAETDKTPEPPKFFLPTAIASIFLQKPLVGLRYMLGWIITGIAISMGASFWFDLLSKLVKVRNTGKPLPTASGTLAKDDSAREGAIKNE